MQEEWEIRWEDYYKILQIDSGAEPEIIQAAYRRLAQKYHPDVNKNLQTEERMKKINRAYEILNDPEKRKRYHLAWLENTGRFKEEPKAYTPPEPRPRPEPTYSPPPPRREKPADQRETRHETYTPPPPLLSVNTKQRMPAWGKWFIGLAVLGLVIGLISQLWPSGISINSLSLDQKIRQNVERWYKENIGYDLNLDRYFIIGEDIWAVRDWHDYFEPGRVIHSSDGGNTWKMEPHMFTVHFFNNTEGLAATNTEVLKTADGGKTWAHLLSIPKWYGYYGMIDRLIIKDKQNIVVYAMNNSNGKFDTSDGGETWEYFICHGRYYGSETVRQQTQNGGETWQKVDIERK